MLRNLADDQLPYAMSTALNSTAFAVQKMQRERMATVFDRPTPLIKGANRVEKATKQNLTAKVLIDPKRAPILQLHEEGGARRGDQTMERYLKSKGWLPAGWKAVPTLDMPKNAYGNPRKTEVAKIIAALPVIGGIKGDARRCFVTAGRKGLGAGIYRYRSRSGGKGLIKLYHFEPVAIYSPRLDWLENAEREARRVLPEMMARAVRRAIETSR